MDNKNLSRRDFMKIAGGAAALTVYAAKTAGAGDAEDAEVRDSKGTLENKSNAPEIETNSQIDSGYVELELQHRAISFLYGRSGRLALQEQVNTPVFIISTLL